MRTFLKMVPPNRYRMSWYRKQRIYIYKFLKFIWLQISKIVLLNKVHFGNNWKYIFTECSYKVLMISNLCIFFLLFMINICLIHKWVLWQKNCKTIAIMNEETPLWISCNVTFVTNSIEYLAKLYSGLDQRATIMIGETTTTKK